MREAKRAAVEEIYQSEFPKRGIQKGVEFGTALASGAGLIKALPFLSRSIPVSLAIKGLEKVFPPIKKFFNEGFKKGLDAESGLEFLREKAEKSQNENFDPLELKRREALKAFNEQKKKRLMDEELQRVQQAYPQFTESQNISSENINSEMQMGAGQKKLFEMLRKINESL